jgi:outer membrane biogenesis lipoprotein LolB
MKDLFMAAFDGLVSIFNKNGVNEIRRVSSGGYSAGEVKDLMDDLLELKSPVSKWSLWIDGIEHKEAETYTVAALRKFTTGNTVELIATRKKNKKTGQSFMVPTIKITAKDAVKATATVNTARLGR